MSDSNKNHQGVVYNQEEYEENGDNNDSQLQQQDEGSSQQNQSSENHNQHRQQQANQDSDHDEGQNIQDNEEQQEEERVVRAQKQPHVQDSHQQLLHQGSNHNAKEKIKDFNRQGNIKDEDDNQQQQQQRNEKKQDQQIHQQKSFQDQQNKQQHQQNKNQQQKSSQDQVLFSQFLNEILEQYKTPQNAFKSIDKHKKGFIEVNDLAIVLAEKFDIDSESKQEEIFAKIGNGNDRINLSTFVSAFQDIMNDKEQQQQQLFSSMNVVTESYDPTRSPFKDKLEREDIINIFANNKEVNLEEANKIEHFSEDCLYAPVIRRLRQQPNFNEFVRSYNTLQFPKMSQTSQNNAEEGYKPFSQLQNSSNNQNKQQQFLRNEIFSNSLFHSYNGAQSLLDEYRSNAHNTLSGSPSRQLKTTANTFSPNRFYQSLDNLKDLGGGKNLNNLSRVPRSNASNGARFLSPQYNRKLNSSYIGLDLGASNYQSQIHGNQLKQSQGNFNFNFASNKQPRDQMNNSKLFSSQDSDFLHRSYVAQPNQGTLTFGAGNPLFQSINGINNNNNLFESHPSQLAQSSYLGGGQRADLRQSPNQKRLNQLKRQVNVGLESLQQVSKPTTDSSMLLNQSYSNSNNQSKIMREQLSQCLSQLGAGSQRNAQASPQRYKGNYKTANPLRDESDRFGDILTRLQGNSRTSNRSLEKKRYNRTSNQDIFGAAHASPFRNNSLNKSHDSPVKFKLSPTGTKGGVHGQMQRVKQIQASLRALPNKQSVRLQRNNQRNKDNNYYETKNN